MHAGTRVAVVTGGNRGLGLETCRQLGRRGMHVVLTARDRERSPWQATPSPLDRSLRAVEGPQFGDLGALLLVGDVLPEVEEQAGGVAQAFVRLQVRSDPVAAEAEDPGASGRAIRG